MSETLSLFGKQISDVAGFHAKNTSGDTITYLDTSDADAVAANILSGKTAYVNGSKVTGNIPSQGAQTITPSTTDQTIAAGKYLTGVQTIAGDANLIAGNIKNGVSIFNVTGTGMTDVTLTQDYNGVIDIPKTTTDVNTIALQIKNATPSASSQSIEPDTGYFGLSKVDISGDANLVPGNIAEGVSIFGVTGTHSGGGYEDSIIDKTISGAYENSRLTSIGSYAFYYCSNLSTVSFPACTTIGDSAFYYCSNLLTASFSACTTIGDFAFNSCSNLLTASFPECIEIGYHAFYNCYSLSTIIFPKCLAIRSGAFYNCYNLPSIIIFPRCFSIGSGAFYNCSNLSTIFFTECEIIENFAFAYCSNLSKANFPKCTTILDYAFRNCDKLVSIYLTASYYVSLPNSNAFDYTPIGGYSATAGQYGSIYVPESMLANYKTLNNWSYFSDRFAAYDAGTPPTPPPRPGEDDPPPRPL